MTREQLTRLFQRYQERFSKWGLERADLERDTPAGMYAGFKHTNWMIQEMLRRIEAGEDKPGQADRWIGFIQAVFWTHGLYSILDLREHTIEASNQDEQT